VTAETKHNPAQSYYVTAISLAHFRVPKY